MGGFLRNKSKPLHGSVRFHGTGLHRSKAVHRQREERENKVTKGGLYERFRKLSRCFFSFFL